MNLSIIIPTLNEEVNVDTLIPLLKVNEKIQIIVADSPNSNDHIENVCKKHKVKYLRCSSPGRAAQMNQGAQLSVYDTLFFVHSDVIPPKGYLESIKQALSEGHQAGFFNYKFDGGPAILKINSYFTKFNGVFAGGGDQTLFITKKTFLDLNGYNEDYCIMEDFDMIRRIKKTGITYKLVDNPLVVSARKYEKNSYLRVNLTNLYLVIKFNLGVAPEKLLSTYKNWIKT